MQYYGLIYFVNNQYYPIPLQNVSVEANIVDMIAETTVCQTYKNIESNTIEAIYKFPLHEATAVCKFEAEIDGKRNIKGIVKEAKQAAKEHDEAIQQGQGAYLLQQHQSDVFQCSIGNITAVRFVFPTAIAPRYGQSGYSPANDGKKLIPDAISYSSGANYYLDLAITCRMTSVIQNIESPSHHISTELNIDGNPNVSKITLAEQITYLEKDFILVVKSLGLDQPRAFVEYNPQTETNCIMLTLVPKFAINTIMSELIFVIDRSGSMQSGAMKKASEALQLLLRSLPEDSYFNSTLLQNSFSKALKHAQEMTANYGGTEIYNPIKWAFENSRNDMPTSVFLLTDGLVNNVDQIVELIKSSEEKKKDDVRLFSIGIGNSVSHELVESVSRAGKGYAQFVTNNERMDKKIIGMLKNAIKPPIKDYNITWTNQIIEDVLPKEIESVDVDKPTISFFSDNTTPPPVTQNFFTDIKIQQAPFVIPPIYPGVRFIVYCILEKGVEACKEIILSATSQDGPMKLSIPLDPVTLQGSKIHTLAARKLIQDLDDGTSFIHKHPRNSGKLIPISLIREQIVKLGIMYSLASKYTSFLAIDERDNQVVAESQNIGKQRIIPTRSSIPFASNSFTTYHPHSQSYVNSAIQPLSQLCSAPVSTPTANCITYSSSYSMPYNAIPFYATGGPALSFRSAAMPNSIPFDYTGPALRLQSAAMACSYVQNSNISYNESTTSAFSTTSVKTKPPKIETLYSFLNFQSFDGSFLPSDKFYSWFGKNNFKEFEIIGINNEKVLCLALAMAYLEILMFETFKEECEMCYEKSKKALKKEIGNDEQKVNEVLEKAKEWVNNWANE
ncbi:1321_t:CDS:10 [Dentiscutata erythropus]|uniref:1321_t:CDS:1 n=1 Tax=Dentiscutata erythropus TaxID=1348616 RepID=A0A9N8VM34_9GLOM|nr:1321_t:CDS:10 [Dentiscutata erythropus]